MEDKTGRQEAQSSKGMAEKNKQLLKRSLAEKERLEEQLSATKDLIKVSQACQVYVIQHIEYGGLTRNDLSNQIDGLLYED